MNGEFPVMAGLFDPAGFIAVDHVCRKCGYNLRGLREEFCCPECGTPVGLSIRGDLLRFADPDWVEKVALGLRIILWMLLLAVLRAIADRLLVFFGDADLWTLSAVVAWIAQLVSFCGAWLMSTPDPARIGEDHHVTARRVVRFALLVGLAGPALQIFAGAFGSSPALIIVFVIILGGVRLVGLVGEFAKFSYYELLARRVPDDMLARRARTLKWGFVISLAVVVLGGLIARAARPGGLELFVCLIGVGTIGLVIFGLLSVFYLLRLSRVLREQARLARESWAVPPRGA